MRKPTLKQILFAGFIGFTLTASADQLAWITREQAEQAQALLNQEKEVLLYCGCCDNDPHKYLKVEGSTVAYTGTDNYFEVQLTAQDHDGNPVTTSLDLAYVFLNREGTANCLGILLGFECDPCTGPFAWTSPFNKAELLDIPVLSENLIYKTADPIAQQGWLLTFQNINHPEEEHLFTVSLSDLEKIETRLIDWTDPSLGKANPQYVGQTFTVSSYTTEAENEFTGEMEIVSFLLNAVPVQNENNRRNSSRSENKNNPALMKEALQTIRDIRSTYLMSGLDDVLRTLSPQVKTGILDIEKMLPDLEGKTELGHEKTGMDECSGSDILCRLYEGGLITEDGVTAHYFYTGELSNKQFKLEKDMTKEEVMAILGRPYTQRSNVLVYLLVDQPEEQYSDNKKVKHYFGGIRVIFNRGKLQAIWVIQKGTC